MIVDWATNISLPSDGSRGRLQIRGLPDFTINALNATEEDTQEVGIAAGNSLLSK